jgi:predicted nucleic acid-binding protein
VIYVDTSAFVKLIWTENESPALAEYLAAHPEPMVSSVLVAIEARRAVLRADAAQLPRTDLLLSRVGQVGITAAVVESASRLPDPGLRSLDAIHLATALLLGPDVDILLSYDTRLLTAAAAHSIVTVSPC